MPHFGLVSITPTPAQMTFHNFEKLYRTIGQNSGNLLFTNAVWKILDGDKRALGFAFKPEKVNDSLDAIIIPAANWLHGGTDFGFLADILEQVKLPVIVIGLGAQADEYGRAPDIPEGSLRFVRAVAERSESMSVRGEFTANVLSDLGFKNVVVTGCPSLFHDFREFDPMEAVAKTGAEISNENCLLHATRYSATHAPYADKDSPNRRLFRLAFKDDFDLLMQSETEEIALLSGFENADVFNDRIITQLKKIYDAENWHELRDYLLAQGKLYIDVDEWAEAVSKYDVSIGTRLHGTIMALNSGTPGCLLWHDSRTREIAEHAQIPHMPASEFDGTVDSVRGVVTAKAVDRYYRRRDEIRETYLDFLRENGVAIKA